MEENNFNNPKPNNYRVWALLTALLCFLPFGIVSIVYSTKVDDYWYAGRQRQAMDAARKAKNWAIAAAISGIVILLIILGVVASARL